MCGLCERRLARRFCEGISRRKTTWEAVPEQQFCGSNPVVSAGRKKYQIKGGGRERPPPAHNAPQCGAFRNYGTNVGFQYFQDLGGRSGQKSSVSKRLGRVGLVPIFFLSENKEIASLIKDKSPRKAPPEEFLTV